jgi:hypothetical protein
MITMPRGFRRRVLGPSPEPHVLKHPVAVRVPLSRPEFDRIDDATCDTMIL